MQVHKTELPGVLIIEPKIFGDERGYFMETWSQPRYAEQVTTDFFVQDNVSFSRRGVLRGLHYQRVNTQAKLVYVLLGEVFDVAVDVRWGSPTFGQWTSVLLSAENKKQFFVPAGFAHGFCVTSETALFAYKCTDVYNPQAEYTVLWNDPALAIPWPAPHPELSAKDAQGTLLAEVAEELLPRY
jgi:dTDP-4-dehydrorhamnose 3,5-epimerase